MEDLYKYMYFQCLHEQNNSILKRFFSRLEKASKFDIILKISFLKDS